MFAFYSNGEILIKAYLHGNDWQLLDSCGNERWFSVWQADKTGSLHRAFASFLGQESFDKCNLYFS